MRMSRRPPGCTRRFCAPTTGPATGESVAPADRRESEIPVAVSVGFRMLNRSSIVLLAAASGTIQAVATT